MTRMRKVLIAGAGLVAVVAMAASAATLADLGIEVGWTEPLHWSLPVAVDVLALVAGVAWLAAGVSAKARALGRNLTLVSVVVSVVLNAVSHLVATGHMVVGPELVIAVSAVPPLAAALAVHLTAAITTPSAADPGTAVAPGGDSEVSPGDSQGVPSPVANPKPALASSQVICGGHLAVPPVPPAPKLGTEEARKVIEQAWRDGLSVREAAKRATRSASQVQRVYTRLDAERGSQPMPGQQELMPTAA